MTHKTLSSAHCNASDWNDVVNIMSAPSLTSNSWGISLRARYSLASLVFISSWISSLFWNEKLIGGGFFPPVFPLIYLWLMGEFVTDLLSAHFPRSCPCGLLKWIPAGDATAPPWSSFLFLRLLLLSGADAWIGWTLFLASRSASLAARCSGLDSLCSADSGLRVLYAEERTPRLLVAFAVRTETSCLRTVHPHERGWGPLKTPSALKLRITTFFSESCKLFMH